MVCVAVEKYGRAQRLHHLFLIEYIRLFLSTFERFISLLQMQVLEILRYLRALEAVHVAHYFVASQIVFVHLFRCSKLIFERFFQ